MILQSWVSGNIWFSIFPHFLTSGCGWVVKAFGNNSSFFWVHGFESYCLHAYKDFFFNKLTFSKIINLLVNQQYYKPILFLMNFNRKKLDYKIHATTFGNDISWSEAIKILDKILNFLPMNEDENIKTEQTFSFKVLRMK